MSLIDPDRMARRNFVRACIRRIAARRNVPVSALAEPLGYTDYRWKQLMTNGDLACPVIADLMLLADILGDELLDELRVREPIADGVGDVARELLGERRGPVPVRPMGQQAGLRGVR